MLIPIYISEEISARLYFDFLCVKGFTLSYYRGDDPPDFIFEYDDKIQAVEVTELHKYLADGASIIPETQSRMFVHGICQQAKRILGNKLNRTISICLSLPLSPEERKRLLDEVVSYVEKNNTEDLYLFGRENCWIASEEGDLDIIQGTTTSVYAKTPGNLTYGPIIGGRSLLKSLYRKLI